VASLGQHGVHGKRREYPEGALFVYIGEPVEQRLQEQIPHRQPFSELYSGRARREPEVEIAAIAGVVPEGITAEKMAVRRVLIGKLPREMRDLDPGAAAGHENSMNLLHGPIVVDQVLQTVGHDDVIDRFVSKRPRVTIQIANQVDARRASILVDVLKPWQRMTA